jgi:ribulose-5-phosphate 4-epimerase/fuculose-1-phosphate aldolase
MMYEFWSERIELAAALRWAARMDLQEAIDNHFSLAVPDPDGRRTGSRFLVNPWGPHWSEITASSLLLCDGDGSVLEGEGEVESSALHIHGPVHRAVPDSPAVLHTHMPFATTLATLNGAANRLTIGQQNAIIFWDNIAYDDVYNGSATDDAEGHRMANALGGAAVLMLAGHGVITVGATIAEAFGYLYYLERAAQVQVLAASTGHGIREFPLDVIHSAAAVMKAEFAASATEYFAYVQRTLGREEPDYLS